MIPDWLATTPSLPAIEAGGSRKGRRLRKHLDKTLEGIGRLGRDAAFMSETGRRGGLLQAIDPRARVLSFLILIIAASIARKPSSLMAVCLLGALLAALSRIPLGRYLGQVWLVVPLFTAAVALPATLNVITPGTIVLPLFSFAAPVSFGPLHLPETVAVTREGLMAAVTLVLRTGASVSLAVLLILATPWHDLLRALQALGIPRPFLMVLSVAWRYLFVLVVAVEEMCMARKSRGIDESRLCAASGSAAQGQGWAASRMGALFRKTRMLGEEVSNAMLSRGFRGEARSLSRFRLRWSDVAWCAGCLSFAVLVACDLISLP